MSKFNNFLLFSTFILMGFSISACAPGAQPGPDKSAGGLLLGAGWGAGMGAIVGNQFGAPGSGVAIGAGVGAVNGLLVGLGLDVVEGEQLQTARDVSSLRMLNAENNFRLSRLEQENRRLASLCDSPPLVAVYFDKGRASLKMASVEQLAHLSKEIRKKRLGTYTLKIRGFSTDLQEEKENESLIAARVKSVENILKSNGVPDTAIVLDETPVEKRAADIVITERGDSAERLNNRVEVFVAMM